VPVEEAEAQQAAASKAEHRDRHESHGRTRSSHGSSRHHERSSRGEGRGRGSSHAAGSEAHNSSSRSGRDSKGEDRAAARASNAAAAAAAAAAQADKAAAPSSSEEPGPEDGAKPAAVKVRCAVRTATHCVGRSLSSPEPSVGAAARTRCMACYVAVVRCAVLLLFCKLVRLLRHSSVFLQSVASAVALCMLLLVAACRKHPRRRLSPANQHGTRWALSGQESTTATQEYAAGISASICDIQTHVQHSS
jgi:hypothetical protein